MIFFSYPFFSHKHQTTQLFPNLMSLQRTNLNYTTPPSPPPPNSSESSFPIVTISIIGILATAILLLSYYTYVTKCCHNRRQFNAIARLHRSLRRHRQDLLALQSAPAAPHGLDDLAIQTIPTFRYRKSQSQHSSNECPVCLNDFKEEERIRLLPNCLHSFHIDCIDAWLGMQANCPVCRSEIGGATTLMTAEIAGEREEVDDDVEVYSNLTATRDASSSITRKVLRLFSMGDECIDVRSSGGEFGVQVMRRSFSLDSSNDRQMYVTVQEVLGKNLGMEIEGSSSAGRSLGRVRRSFFTFGHYGSSKNSVLPINGDV